MDPVANLKRQLELATWITNLSDRLADIRESIVGGGTPGELAVFGADLLEHETKLEESATELAELVTALDKWRRSGGFDPYSDRGEFPHFERDHEETT